MLNLMFTLNISLKSHNFFWKALWEEKKKLVNIPRGMLWNVKLYNYYLLANSLTSIKQHSLHEFLSISYHKGRNNA